MSSISLQQLLRIFYRYEVRVVLFLQNGVIAGYLNKSDIEELMSDLSRAKTITELPVVPAKNLEQLLELHHQEGFLTDTGRFLPVVNETWEEEGLYNRAQIIQIWEKPRISIQRSGESSREPVAPRGPTVITRNSEKPSQSTSAPEERQKRPEKREEIHVQPPSESVSPVELSTLTLEALPIPMLALDTRGNLLFHNQDWTERTGAGFEILDLMKTARNRMAEMAFAGNLEVDSLLEIEEFIPGTPIRMKTIRKEQGPQSKVIGYLFWIEPVAPAHEAPKEEEEKPAPEKPPEKPRKKESEDSGTAPSSRNFMGRTLPDILEEEERKVLAWAMDEAGNNQSNAAMLLGIPRQTFAYRYKKLFS